MKRILLTTISLLTTLLYAQTGPKGTLVWSDEFNTAGPLNEADWNYEHGFVRNYELQWYQPDNAICRDGCLIITARHEQVKNPNYIKPEEPQTDSDQRRRRRPDWRQQREYAEYTSASVNTRGKKEFLYGTLEVRARIPVLEGAWPAIWTLGSQWQR